VLVEDRRDPEPVGTYARVPCSMLLRDFGALCGGGWEPSGGGYVFTAPKGSVAVLDGPDADEVLAVLRDAGAKVLQAYALALEAWSRRAGGRPERSVRCGAEELARLGRPELEGAPARREASEIRDILRALARVKFVSAPGGRPSPGAPLRLGERDGPHRDLAFAPGPAWVADLASRAPRRALLPWSFFRLHAKNDRYVIMLAWHLAIMLRVNRKYGYSYHVRLGTLLRGAGIAVPARNTSRFIAAVYRALHAVPGVVISARPFTLYSAETLLDSLVVARPSPASLLAYGEEGRAAPA
jgi:hypothetical protein